MKHHFTAARNTCFALIAAIERDLRTLAIEQSQLHGVSSLLPEELRTRALARWQADQSAASTAPPEADADLLDYIDIADLDYVLGRVARAGLPALRRVIGDIRSDLSRLAPVRNRVCHSRPLEHGDLSVCLDVTSRLTSKTEVPFTSLQHTQRLVAENPRFVLGVEIPAFWAFRKNRIHHNLPLPEFDDTGFLGRSQDRKELKKLLCSHFPVVTVVGEGGIGKTALALQCLYDLLDEDESPYDAVVWSSLKMTALTASGVVQISNDIASTLNLLGSLANALGTPDATELTEDFLYRELAEYMNEFRVLLAIDNLETLADARLRTLVLSIPPGSKILITSRVGIGEFETRYRLESMDDKTSIHLMRCVAHALGSEMIFKASDASLKKYSDQLFGNPLLLKWFVSAISRGADPSSLLGPTTPQFNEALGFCFANVFDNITTLERRLINTLVCARRPLTAAEIFFLISDHPKSDIEWALASLNTSSVIRRSEVQNESVRYQVSAPAASYISSNRPPTATFFGAIQERMREVQKMASRRNKWKDRNEYEIFSVRPKNHDERIAALSLCQALDCLHNGDLKAARRKVEESKRLLPTFSEAYRISGLIESKDEELYAATDEFQRAVDCDPTSTIVRYTYTQFILKYLGNADLAIEHAVAALQYDPDHPTLLSTKALVLSRCERFDEAALIYRGLLKDIAGRPKRWRVTTRDQAADCYRYWSRVDVVNLDKAAFSEHIRAAQQELVTAVECGDYDEKTIRKIGMTLCEGAAGARRLGDVALVEELVTLVEYAASAMPGGKITFTNPSTISTTLSRYGSLLDRVRTVSAVAIPTTAVGDHMRSRTSTDDEPRAPLSMGRIDQVWPERRYGFLRDERGNRWFFHYSQLTEMSMEAELRPAMQVSYRVGRNAQGECAVCVSVVSGNSS